MSEVVVKEEKSNALKYIILFIIFLALGVGLGIFGTKKYLEYKKDKENDVVIDEGPEDITNVDEYSELVNRLHSFVLNYSLFYTTKGVKASSMSNGDRLMIVYDQLKNEGKVLSESLTATLGSNTCLSKFIIDNPSANLWTNNSCTVTKVERKLFDEKNLNLFNDSVLDTSVEFVNSEGKLCVVSESMFICGTGKETSEAGSLESKFDIVKVTKDEGTIVIYDKGYLLDNRTTIPVLNDGKDKHYLHSSDSTEYYYELKSADNLTFKHTFVTKDRVNYYYVSSELVKE